MKKFLILLSTLSFLTACSSKEDILDEDTFEYNVIIEEKETIVTPEIVENYEGMEISPYTGLYVDEEIANSRAIAVTINNLHKALPQSGLSQADIIYEVLAEGEITRLVAIFQDFTSEKIGPVRSARDYFNLFALDHDAIYIHHGGSPDGYSTISSRKVENLDGMYDYTAFFRDTERMNTSGMYEHSSYIKSSGVLESIQKYDTTYTSSPVFSWDNESVEYSSDVTNITIPYSNYQISEFRFNNGLYERYQSGLEHIDEETGEILTFNNVVVQYAKTAVIDSEGRRSVDLITTGEGKLFKNGEVFDITWEKDDEHSSTQWYLDGEPMTLTPGKTFVCVVPLTQAISMS